MILFEDDPFIDDVREKVDSLFIREEIEKILLTLTDRERVCLKLKFFEDLTLDEIGKQINVSRERVRQIIAKGLRKLRHPKRVEQFAKIGVIEANSLLQKQVAKEKQKVQEIVKELHKSHDKYFEKIKEATRKASFSRPEFVKIVCDYDNEELKELGEEGSNIKKTNWSVSLPSIFINPPKAPPRFVVLVGDAGCYHLETTNEWTIQRNRDPKTYDQWLKHLISQKG